MTIKQFLKERKIHISYKERSDFGSLVASNIKRKGIVVNKVSEQQQRGRLTFNVLDYPESFIPTLDKIYKQYKFIKKYQSEVNTS